MPDTKTLTAKLATSAPAPELFPPNSLEPLPQEQRARMIQRALDTLSGRIEPDALVTPPEVRAEIEALKREHPRTTPGFIRHITDVWNLGFYYGGNVVAAVDTPKGCVVLAAGNEIGPLRRALSDDDNRRVYTTHPTDPNCPLL